MGRGFGVAVEVMLATDNGACNAAASDRNAVRAGRALRCRVVPKLAAGCEPRHAIAASILAIADLSNPLRHRIREFTDRRLCRKRYDVGRPLDASKPGALGDDLASVTSRTVGCVSASLWLGGARTGDAGVPS